jgi:opacity protein-like surface antigen
VISSDWTGVYLGGQLGYGDLSTSGAASVEGDDALGGLHVGYNFDLGSYVLGAELDYDVADIDLGGAGTLDSVARLKLRGGYDVGPTLIYGTAGLAMAEATLGGVNQSGDGYFLGLGASYDLGNNFVLGGEFLNHQFDDFDNTGIDIDANTIAARVSFKF